MLWKLIPFISLLSPFVIADNDDMIPDNIRNLVLPDMSRAEGNDYVGIDIPDTVQEYLTKDPSSYLYGSCLQLYLGYRDGLRMHDLLELLGPEMHDAMVEFVVYDFLAGDCAWIKDAWGTVQDGWQYVEADDPDNIFYRERTDTMSTIIAWFSWWIEREGDLQYTIYEDGYMAWKMAMAAQFLSLKQSDELVSDTPDLDTLKEDDEMLKELAERVKKNGLLYKSEDWEADNRGGGMCNRLCPVSFFAHKYEFIIDYFLLTIKHDITRHPDRISPYGWFAKLALWVEGCAGVCIRIGTGIRYNPVKGDVCIDQSYGIGSQVDVSTYAAVRGEASFFCGSSEELDNLFSGSMVTDNDMEWKLIYSENWDQFLGISFTVPYDSRYMYQNHLDKFNFHYYKCGNIACRNHPRFVSEALVEALDMQSEMDFESEALAEADALQAMEVSDEVKRKFKAASMARAADEETSLQGMRKLNANGASDFGENDSGTQKWFLLSIIGIAIFAVLSWSGFCVYRLMCRGKKDEDQPLLGTQGNYAAYA